MQCADVRNALAADPGREDAELDAHLAGCTACSAYAADMRHLDRHMRTALAIPVPDLPPLTDAFYATGPDSNPAVPASTASAQVVEFPTRRTAGVARRGAAPFAMAAGVAAVAVLVGLLWAGYPRETLASAVVGHLAEEPLSWTATAPVPPATVVATLRRTGVKLVTGGMPPVTYLQSCYFRGHYVPHFVVRTDQGPVTVLVLPDEPIQRRTNFDENGYRGVLVRSARGSVALLARDPSADLDDTATQVLASVHYVK